MNNKSNQIETQNLVPETAQLKPKFTRTLVRRGSKVESVDGYQVYLQTNRNLQVGGFDKFFKHDSESSTSRCGGVVSERAFVGAYGPHLWSTG